MQSSKIASREYTTNLEENLRKLSFLDFKHDFKAIFSTDRIVQTRGAPDFDHFQGFKPTIYRKALELDPTYSYFFDGCNAGYGGPEEIGYSQAIKVATPKAIKLDYTPNTLDAFYTAMAGHLSAYKVDGKIPLVIDFEFHIYKNATNIRDLGKNFVICKNKEQYSDPSKTYKKDYGQIYAVEVGNAERTYGNIADDGFFSGIGPITFQGTVDNMRVIYGGTEIWADTFKSTDRVAPNTIANCKKAYKTLTAGITAKSSNQFNYCAAFKEAGDFPSTIRYPPPLTMKRIAAQVIKKRCGDQIQAASCLKTIKYAGPGTGGQDKTYGSKEKPCVFWSHDALAISYAILHKIPCVHERVNGNVVIYIPSGAAAAAAAQKASATKMKGGACTRRNLQITEEDIQERHYTRPVLDLINDTSSSDCLNRFLELSLEYDKPEFEITNLLNLLFFIKASRSDDKYVEHIPDSLLNTQFALNEYGQMYVEGEGEEQALKHLKASPASLFFKGGQGNALMELYVDSPQTKSFAFYIGDAKNKRVFEPAYITARQDLVAKYMNSLVQTNYNLTDAQIDSAMANSQGTGWFNPQAIGIILLILLLLSGMRGGGSGQGSGGGSGQGDKALLNSSIEAIQRIASSKDILKFNTVQFIHIASLFFFQLLQAIGKTEAGFLIFKENADNFFVFDDSKELLFGGYTAYDLVYFIETLIEEFNRLKPETLQIFFTSIVFLPDLLRDIEEDFLLSNFHLFMNTFSDFNLFHNATAFNRLSKELRSDCKTFLKGVVAEAQKKGAEIEKELAKFDHDDKRAIAHLHSKLPLGYLNRISYMAFGGIANLLSIPLPASVTVKNMNKRSVTRKNRGYKRKVGQNNNSRRSITQRTSKSPKRGRPMIAI